MRPVSSSTLRLFESVPNGCCTGDIYDPFTAERTMSESVPEIKRTLLDGGTCARCRLSRRAPGGGLDAVRQSLRRPNQCRKSNGPCSTLLETNAKTLMPLLRLTA